MKTIVTGGCGFIGSHLTEQLLNEGNEVLIIDNLSTGRLLNIAHLKSNKNLSFVEADIADYQTIEPYFERVDWVFHIAALADIVPSIEQPLNYHHSNVNGTISVLEASRKNNVSHFIYAASSSCYGIPDNYPTPETDEIRPQYPYATTKYIGEQYVMNWAKIYNLPVTSLRFFNVYGPRSRTSGTYGAVFGVFLAQKLNDKPFTIVGDGTQTRDFTFVKDVANACIMAAKNINAIGEIMNVGSGNTYSVNKLVDLLKGKVIYIPKRPGEPDCTFADTTKIISLINWEPKVSFEEGVKIMLENIDYWREAPVWEPESIANATKDWFKYLK
ncbi:SDR family oxidoreductase [Bacteroidota bacterium]